MEGQEFIDEVVVQGGVADFLEWGSAGNFPDELVGVATVAESALDVLTYAIENYVEAKGLEYEL